MSAGDMLAALANKSVDAVLMAEPALTKAVDQGLVVRGRDVCEKVCMTAGLIFFSPKFDQNQDAGTRFMVAYVKALRDYNDAFVKNKGRKEVVEVLAKATGNEAALIERMDLPGLDPDGYAVKDGIARANKYWMTTGELKEDLAMDKIVDDRFVDAALQKLGKYVR